MVGFANPQWRDYHVCCHPKYGYAKPSTLDFLMARKDIRTISIRCAKCKSLLYKYRKGGRGRLVKCMLDRIAEDHTRGDMHCPKCGQAFARFKMYGGQAAHKIIQGKVFTKGMG